MSELQEKFLLQLTEDLTQNRIALPTLPEIALQVKKVIDNEQSTPAQIARIIGSDAALCMRLLRVANSVIYRSRYPVRNIQDGISRLGIKQVHNIVNILVMEQLYQMASIKSLRPHLNRLWLHSTRVSAIAAVLARRYSQISPEQAMLGGLIHDVGILPILSRAESYPGIFNYPQIMNAVIADLHGDIGYSILESWRFPLEFAIAAAQHDNLNHNSAIGPNLVDIIQVANLLNYVGTDHPHTAVDWNTVPAFTKLGVTPAIGIAILKDAEAEIQETLALFT